MAKNNIFEDYREHDSFGDNAVITEIIYDDDIKDIHKFPDFRKQISDSVLRFLKFNKYIPENKERLCRVIVLSSEKNKRYEFDVFTVGEQLLMLLEQAMEYAKTTDNIDDSIIVYKFLKEYKEKTKNN